MRSGGPVELAQGDLEAWGRAIGSGAGVPLFVGLEGPLGAGKSVLARSIARGAGVEGPVPSPTYALVHGYEPDPGRRVVHMDLYRLDHPDDVAALGWEELLSDPEALVLVEWAERAGPLLPPDRWTVRLAPVAGRPELRRVEWAPSGRPGPLPSPPAASGEDPR